MELLLKVTIIEHFGRRPQEYKILLEQLRRSAFSEIGKILSFSVKFNPTSKDLPQILQASLECFHKRAAHMAASAVAAPAAPAPQIVDKSAQKPPDRWFGSRKGPQSQANSSSASSQTLPPAKRAKTAERGEDSDEIHISSYETDTELEPEHHWKKSLIDLHRAQSAAVRPPTAAAQVSLESSTNYLLDAQIKLKNSTINLHYWLAQLRCPALLGNAQLESVELTKAATDAFKRYLYTNKLPIMAEALTWLELAVRSLPHFCPLAWLIHSHFRLLVRFQTG